MLNLDLSVQKCASHTLGVPVVNVFYPPKYFDKNYSQPGNWRICLKFYRLKFASNLRFMGVISAGFVSLVKSELYQ